MEIFLKCVHILAATLLILVVLLQSGRGGGMGPALGGASSQIFGGRGASNFLSRVTSGLAVAFFLTSLTLSMISSRHRSVVSGTLPGSTSEAAAPAPDAAPAQEDKAAPAPDAKAAPGESPAPDQKPTSDAAPAPDPAPRRRRSPDTCLRALAAVAPQLDHHPAARVWPCH